MNLNGSGFKFNLGEIVQHRINVPSVWDKKRKASPLLIISREAEECSVGVQFHYGVRVGAVENHGNTPSFEPSRTYRVHEIELEPIPEEKEEE